MQRHLKIQTFEIYGECISIYTEPQKIVLTKVGRNKYIDKHKNIWTKKGVSYLRNDGKEHGFFILKDYDKKDEDDDSEFEGDDSEFEGDD